MSDAHPIFDETERRLPDHEVLAELHDEPVLLDSFAAAALVQLRTAGDET